MLYSFFGPIFKQLHKEKRHKGLKSVGSLHDRTRSFHLRFADNTLNLL